jgi:predicted TPR repeat methyltransferase
LGGQHPDLPGRAPDDAAKRQVPGVLDWGCGACPNVGGDVAGRRILDAGCGSGPISTALRDRGASMTGFDSSAGMLALAQERLGPDADLHLADLGAALPFPDDAFDDVIAALVLHYLQDWT